MAQAPRSDQQPNQNRPIDLTGDSPELIAFALLRHIAQLEQRGSNRPTLDRAWVLDAYSECLAAVRGQRNNNTAKKPVAKR